MDVAGNVYVTDGAANVVRKINHADGEMSTIAGTFLGFNVVDPTPHAGDGGAATTAHLNVPFGVAVAANNDIYIADAGNQVVRRIDATKGAMSVFAGTYSQPPGYTGDGGAAVNAALYTPYDVAIDQAGNVFIADKDNHAIRRVAAGTGIISTVAGGGPARKGYSGDNGPATSARLNTPQGIAVATNGDLYIADAGNHVIRRVDAGSRIISTFAGAGTSGYSGDNGPATAAQLSSPTRVCLDPSGNVYIADHGNHVIRRVERSGTITSIAGVGLPGFSGDGGPAIAAQLSSPFGIANDNEGNLLITDNGNSVVRAIAPSGN
jgi:streptogramin lyase